jgi:peroxiredoxin (alkyl hydroperoxide reductase subunit C)
MGINFDELKRALIAMQTADAYNVATPADWQPGDAVIVPTAGSCGIAKDRMETKEEGVLVLIGSSALKSSLLNK